MADNAVQIRVNADLSKAQAAIAALKPEIQAATGSMGQSFQQAGVEVERGLINSRQSVHLLAEEMGINLPRAVVRAVSQMLPSIDQMGGALLAVFAVKEAVEWGTKAYEEIQYLRGATKELEQEWKGVISEQEKFLTNFKTIAGGETLIAESQRRLSEVEAHISQIKKDMEGLPFGAAVKALFLSHQLTEAEAERSKLVERLNNQLATSTQLHKEEAKADEKNAKDAARAAKEAFNQWSEGVSQQYAYFEHRRQEEKLAAAEAERIAREMDGLQEHHIELLREEEIFRSKADAERAKENSEMLKGINLSELNNRLLKEQKDKAEQLRVVWANANPLAANMRQEMERMGISAKGLTMAQMELAAATRQFSEAANEQVMAVQKHMIASTEQATAGLAGLIGGRKAQAAVEMAWEIGQGIQLTAEGIWGEFGPNPAAIIAGAMHFEAAAQYGMVAGSGGGSRSGGGSGGGSQSSYGRGGGGAGGSSSGGGAATPGSGTMIHVHVQGLISPDNLTQVMSQMSTLVKGGQATLNATNALYNGEKLG